MELVFVSLRFCERNRLGGSTSERAIQRTDLLNKLQFMLLIKVMSTKLAISITIYQRSALQLSLRSHSNGLAEERRKIDTDERKKVSAMRQFREDCSVHKTNAIE